MKTINDSLIKFFSFNWLYRLISRLGNLLLLLFLWLEKSFKTFVYIGFSIFIIGFLTLFSISYFQQGSTQKSKYHQINDKLNPVEYIINSFNSSKDSIKYPNNNVSPPTKNLNATAVQYQDANTLRGKILEDTANIIGHTSNLLSYITIFFALIGILVGFGIYKFVTKINILDNETETLKNKTLEAGLTTISAVPLVEATQITSDEYYLAIETITNSIIENRENIDKYPKYSKLLIVEALHYWNLRNYYGAKNVLEKALKLAFQGVEDHTIKTVNYHLARVFKQWGFERNNNDYLKKALEFANNTFEQQKKVIKLSVASIRFDKEKDEEKKKKNRENLITELKNCIGIEENQKFSNNDEIKDFVTTQQLSSFA